MDIVEGLRKVIQDLLVPELKAVQVEIGHLNEGLKLLREEINKRFEETNQRFEKMDKRFEEMNRRFEEQIGVLHKEMNEKFNDLKETQMKIFVRLDLEPRISRLEIYYEDLKTKLESKLILKEPNVKYPKKVTKRK